MWIMLNDAFLSIVDKAEKPGCLVVRARRPGDIEAVFPGADVVKGAGTDYAFRAEIARIEVAEALADRVMALDYSNFKDSVSDPDLHRACSSVWHVLMKLQQD